MQVISKHIYFQRIQEKDAEYIYTLRTKYGKYLNNLNFTRESNLQYIQEYCNSIHNSLSLQSEYYFLIMAQNKNIGLVRLYNIDYIQKEFVWGSWILTEHGRSALQSAMLVYTFAFTYLGLEKAYLEVIKDNTQVVQFHKKMGAIITHEDDTTIYYTFSQKEYNLVKEKYNIYIDTNIQVKEVVP